ncbi:beta-ketoacyl synthase N-terminal-like domain-containing protein [Streptomyces sp. NPDC017991]|uniref:beta-ketoacyl synthase N-terminal-like domain-containing protein n=1 Tax=Streptomyces sp. NPDC017991 TaxID=3365026 RepID=UPI0037A8BC94
MSASRTAVRALVTERLHGWYGLPPAELSDDRPLAEAGLTSRDALALTAALGELVGRRLPDTLLWDAPTIDALAERLAEDEPQATPAPARTPLSAPGSPVAVAVVGVGCRFPGGVTSADAYWRLLTRGRDAVGTLPAGRWDPFVRDPEDLPDDVIRHGAFLGGLDAVAGFDAEFFGIPAHEATAMDPQHRMLLEVTREALDHACLAADALAGTRTGVFVGISGNEYAHLTTAGPRAVDAWTATGAALSVAAGRLSYALDLRGPSLAVDTACSSSLVAVHHAVRSLMSGESDTALAAGANLLLTPAVTLGFQRAGALAPDGRCKAFDAAADGIVRGEGCGVVVLKRLTDAERDGDRVLAVIRATAVNSDGRSNGLTAPNAEAQRALLAEAHTDPATVDYVEAHGTGTALGDPIEASALGAVLGRDRTPEQPLLIGSAKTNLGHLEAAAGIAGLVKTVLALHHGEVPGQLHFTRPGPHADLDALGLRVVTSPEPWPRYSGTATAGVSAFGFGGTNAHAVLTEHRPTRTGPPASGTAERPALLLLDGPTTDRVRAYAGELAAWLDTPGGRRVRDADLTRTLAGRTGRGRHRAALVTRDRTETVTALTRLADGAPSPHLITGHGAPGGPGPVVWVFSGYGSQWPGMGSRLLATEPVFAAAVDRLEPLLREHADLSLRAGLRPDADLSTPATVMPVLYGIQVALAELWRSYGLEPAAVIGHSLGEIAAAVVSGELDPATGARIVAVRSRLLARLDGGAMAVVDLPATRIPALAREFKSLRVAVHASPAQSVVTGSAADVSGLVARVTDAGGFARSLGVSAAGHSPEVEPLLPEFAWELGEIRPSAPRCRRYSTALDDPRAAVPCDTEYWAANLRNPVRFAQAVRAAAEDGHRVFVEVAPHATQSHPLTETLRDAGAEDALVVPTLRRGTDDAVGLRTSLATLLVHGVRVARPREGLAPGGRIVDVPPPRWRHRRFWAGEETPPDSSFRAARPTSAPGTAETPLDRLRLCVAGVMGYAPDRLDPDTPLTDLGLDSLTAVRIRTAVQQEFDTDVEPATLLKQATLRAIANLLPPAPSGARGTARPATTHPHPHPHALRTFPSTGPHTPLFLAHAAGGSAAVYARLAAGLEGDRPVHGFDRQPDPDDVPARAAEFARRIREVRPNGPWTLGGWSYGGLVAQEAAGLLAPYGQVAALVLLDSILPLPTRLPPAEQALRHFRDFAAYVERTYGTALDLPYDELAGLDDTGRIDLVIKVLRDTVELPEAVLDHQRTSYLDLRSGERHLPGGYSGRTLLYRASEPAPYTVRDPRYEREDATLGWDAHCTDLTVVPLPGHHLSLLDPPVVDQLARLLTRDLRDS